VVSGYVRCPKCHAGLSTGRIKRLTADPGGTALPERRFPIAPVVVALGVAAAIIVVFGIRGGSKQTEAAPPPHDPIPATPDPSRQALMRAPVPVPAPEAPAPAASDTTAVIRELEDTLHRQRLWGRVELTGQRIDVRSGSCGDRAMGPLIDGKRTLLHGAGLTKLRCLEQSGAVVFERDL
jgi:hypothetical protein